MIHIVGALSKRLAPFFKLPLKYKEFPGGPQRFENIIHGGELFETILLNRYNIFMTHLQNYGNGRLSLRLFDAYFTYMMANTNIKLRQIAPKELARKYFDQFKSERDVIFNNPCDDKRHLEIIATNPENRRELFDSKLMELTANLKDPKELSKLLAENPNTDSQKLPICFNLPDIIIVGPQKTGTTAFTFFLDMHPLFVGNRDLPDSFEETQFFTKEDKYFRGVDWYNQWFVPENVNDFVENDSSRFVSFSAGNAVRKLANFQKRFIFEKSANYFTAPAPTIQTRINTLLPRAIMVAILLEPGQRAYSWYQHQRAHNDPTAMKYTFEQVLRSEDTQDHQLQSLRSKCLYSGMYVKHLKNWSSKNTLVLIDGQKLRSSPAEVMNEFVETIQNLFLTKYHSRSGRPEKPSIYDSFPAFNFSNHLYFDTHKKFYCKKSTTVDSFKLKQSRSKCLGSGKGRSYAEMSASARKFLDSYYFNSNRDLKEYLIYVKQKLPVWLK